MPSNSRLKSHGIAPIVFLFMAWLASSAPLYAIPIKIAPQARDWRMRNESILTTSGVHDPADKYKTPNGWGVAYTLPQHPVPAERLPSIVANFTSVFNASQSRNKWTYRFTDTPISDDSFLIRTYDAHGSAAAVGADIDIQYKPTDTDPTFQQIHWIQVVTNNHKLHGAHGVDDNVLDIAAGQRDDPFYDTGGLANARDFFDAPRRLDVEENHFWRGVLFLATGIPKADGSPGGDIIIYSNTGIHWGWANMFFPNVEKVAFHEEAHDNWLDEVPPEEFVVYHDAFHNEFDAIPEPSSVALIVIASIGLVISRRRQSGGQSSC